MRRQYSIHSLLILAAVLSPAVVSLVSLVPQFPALGLKFPPVDDRKAPAVTTGGGTRGPSCIEKEPVPLISLMPSRNNWGKTVSATPSLYWYLPPTTAKTGEFELLDADGNQSYKTELTLPSQPGVVMLSLPKTVALEVDQNYEWYFTLVCDQDDRSQDMFVQGFLQRTEMEPSIETQLASTTDPLARARLYAQQGIWYETLSTLADVRDQHPEEWAELLLSVDLPQEIVQADFLTMQSAQGSSAPAGNQGSVPKDQQTSRQSSIEPNSDQI